MSQEVPPVWAVAGDLLINKALESGLSYNLCDAGERHRRAGDCRLGAAAQHGRGRRHAGPDVDAHAGLLVNRVPPTCMPMWWHP